MRHNLIKPAKIIAVALVIFVSIILYGYFSGGGGILPQVDYGHRNPITYGSAGIAVVICLTAGVVLFRRVRQSRLHPTLAVLIFIPLTAGTAFLPRLLMPAIARAIGKESLYWGDAGWDLLLVSYFMLLFSGAAILVFIVSVCISCCCSKKLRNRLEPTVAQSAASASSDQHLHKRNRRRILVASAALLIVTVSLFIGGRTYRFDNYCPDSSDARQIGDAKCFVHLFASDEIRSSSLFLFSKHLKDTCCIVTVLAFNPAYDAFRVTKMVVLVDGIKRADLVNPPVIDDADLVFKPYIDKDRFRAEFPNVDPREASYGLIPDSATTPALARPPVYGSTITVEVGLDILSSGKSVCSTNLNEVFTLCTEERHRSWAEMLFMTGF